MEREVERAFPKRKLTFSEKRLIAVRDCLARVFQREIEESERRRAALVQILAATTTSSPSSTPSSSSPLTQSSMVKSEDSVRTREEGKKAEGKTDRAEKEGEGERRVKRRLDDARDSSVTQFTSRVDVNTFLNDTIHAFDGVVFPGASLTFKDFRRLRPGGWISDNHIEFTLNRVRHEVERTTTSAAGGGNRDALLYLDPQSTGDFIITDDEGARRERLGRYLSRHKINVRDVRAVIVPWNVNTNHWIVAVVCRRHRVVVVYDSFADDATMQRLGERVTSWYDSVFLDYARRRDDVDNGEGEARSDPSLREIVTVQTMGPRDQIDAESCGIYTIARIRNWVAKRIWDMEINGDTRVLGNVALTSMRTVDVDAMRHTIARWMVHELKSMAKAAEEKVEEE